ncbi:Multidrug resistance protein MdtC [Roseobacter fucihabitans]|uniref:Multidrug resistance protein MdtC n=1 Tax=Roseobacter fucihabitans TaxID=1537242 RepID=A0ABZ2BVC7_9RHOB|nr:efflux RND transporter permease subunit [Roseobacter litoralis]MBC6967162.1 Multidrug resistance protein MdtC [Roseobacter litoralis]
MARQIPGAARGVLSYFARHRTLANLILVMMVVAGLAALPNMRTQFFPDTVLERVTVNTSWANAASEDVDRGIVQVLEPALRTVEGVESTSSTARQGRGTITLHFEPNWDMTRAAGDVQDAVDTVTDLPDGADDPVVRRAAWRDRVTDVVISGPVGPEQLGLFADEFVNRLFAAGITRATIRGVAAPQITVEVSTLNLVTYGITMAEIAAAIEAEVDTAPAGNVRGANTQVRTGTEKRDPELIAQIVLRSNPDGSKLNVGDVARITKESGDRNRAYFVGQNPAISVRVDRSAQGDAIKIQASVEEIAADLQATLPAGSSLELIRTRAAAISDRLDILIDNGLMGLGLVLGLLFLFLNARTAFWVAAGIPAAMLAAIAIMYAGGITLNMISLFGLIITLGIVVDDAIVVGEHADYRARHLKEDPFVAAESAARRMSIPVFAATLTTVIAFFGLLAVGGRFGTLIQDIPLTVIAVLVASLVECFLILPNHMAHSIARAKETGFSRLKLGGALVALVVLVGGTAAFGARLWLAPEGALIADLPYRQDVVTGLIALGVVAGVFLLMPRARKAHVVQWMGMRGVDWPSTLVNYGFDWMRDVLFRRFMAGVIAARYVVLAGLIVLLAAQVSIFIRGDVQWRFFNAPERGSVTGNFAMTEGATRADSIAMMQELQRATEELSLEYAEKYGRNPVDFVLAQVGGTIGRGLDGAEFKDNDLLGGISIELIDADLRPYSSFAFTGDLRDRVASHPLIETLSFRGWRSGQGGDALSVEFSGADTQRLKTASLALQDALLEYPEVLSLQDDLAYGREELILDLTAKGQALGFRIDTLGRVLRDRLGGIEAATYPEGARTATIEVQLPDDELTADFLERTQMRTPEGVYVPLADIVSVQSRDGFLALKRQNGTRVITVSGDISEDDPERAAEIQRVLSAQILPRIASEHQVSWSLGGLAEQEQDFLSDALSGLILCLLGIFLVLAWVFGSWSRPFLIMAVIPFGLIGTIYGHVVWEVPLSMFTVVGLLGMTGIIINDSIVLITTIDEYAEDRGLIPSIIDGAADRLRPVMLTTMTTVLGMTPLLHESSRQAQFLKPTVITLVYGLGFGVVLVLMMVPALVAVSHDISRQIRAMRRGMQAPVLSLRMSFVVLWGLILGWAGATMGVAIAQGSLAFVITALVPGVQGWPVMPAALLLFVIGAAALVLLAYLCAVLIMLLRKRAPAP